MDIAVNSAATAQYGPFETMAEADIDEMLAIIFKAGIWFMQAAIAAMKEAGGGAIVYISTAAAKFMLENHAACMRAEAGPDHVTRTVANEFGKIRDPRQYPVSRPDLAAEPHH